MAKKATFDHLKSGKKPLERIVTIYLDDEPIQALREAETALAADAENADLLQAVEQAKEAVEESAVTLLFRSIGRKKYDQLIRLYPATEEQSAEHKEQFGSEAPYDADEFSVALIAASCADPVLSEAQVRELRDDWNTSEYVELFTAALEVNTQRRVANLGNLYG